MCYHIVIFGWESDLLVYYPSEGISRTFQSHSSTKQAGAELGQAQLKLGLDFNSINLNQPSLCTCWVDQLSYLHLFNPTPFQTDLK